MVNLTARTFLEFKAWVSWMEQGCPLLRLKDAVNRPEQLKILSGPEKTKSYRKTQGQTVLHRVATYCTVNGTAPLEYILQMGADPNAMDHDGRTPCDQLFIRISDIMTRVEDKAEGDQGLSNDRELRHILACLRCLVAHGADVNACAPEAGNGTISFEGRRLLSQCFPRFDGSQFRCVDPSYHSIFNNRIGGSPALFKQLLLEGVDPLQTYYIDWYVPTGEEKTERDFKAMAEFHIERPPPIMVDAEARSRQQRCVDNCKTILGFIETRPQRTAANLAKARNLYIPSRRCVLIVANRCDRGGADANNVDDLGDFDTLPAEVIREIAGFVTGGQPTTTEQAAAAAVLGSPGVHNWRERMQLRTEPIPAAGLTSTGRPSAKKVTGPKAGTSGGVSAVAGSRDAELSRLQGEIARLTATNERLAGHNERLAGHNERLAGHNERLSRETERLAAENEGLRAGRTGDCGPDRAGASAATGGVTGGGGADFVTPCQPFKRAKRMG